jgi:hypothetical protein
VVTAMGTPGASGVGSKARETLQNRPMTCMP